MLIDILVAILIAVAVFKGWRKGFVVAVFSFAAFVIGLAAALKLSAAMAIYLGQNISIAQRWLPVLAFIAVFILVVLLVKFSAKAIERLLSFVMLGWVNKLGGIVFFALLYLFVFSIVLFYADNLHLIANNTIQASATYPFLKSLAPKIINALGIIIPIFKNIFTQLTDFFDALSPNK